jgi:hypothetical protein
LGGNSFGEGKNNKNVQIREWSFAITDVRNFGDFSSDIFVRSCEVTVWLPPKMYGNTEPG